MSDSPSMATVREAAQRVLEGFESGVFIRNVSRDSEPGWALKVIPYIQALATLQRWTKS